MEELRSSRAELRYIHSPPLAAPSWTPLTARLMSGSRGETREGGVWGNTDSRCVTGSTHGSMLDRSATFPPVFFSKLFNH
jgi:hypothetical protein